MTDLVSTALMSRGFQLKQLPVSVKDQDGKTTGDGKVFYIGMDSLKEMQATYGVNAVMLGNVFITIERSAGNMSEKRVVSAHIKIVDIKTLDILAQVTLPDSAHGFTMDETSEEIANALFGMSSRNRPSQSLRRPQLLPPNPRQ